MDKEKVTLGDAPIEEKYKDGMRNVAKVLDRFFNGELRGQDRFVLLVFPVGEENGGRCNFISNGVDRNDVVALMKEMIARFEGQPETKGNA